LTHLFSGDTLQQMLKINTALGTIQAEQLGITLMHEHMVIGYPGWDTDNAKSYFDLVELAEIVAAKLGAVKNFGVQTVIDATPDDLGRNAELNKMIANETGLNIICSTGKYMDQGDPGPHLNSREKATVMVNALYDTFMRDITVGIHNTGIRAGIIKVATSQSHIFPYEEIALKAAAKAQKETGVPIITHTQEGTMGPKQASLLLSEGADPVKVVIGHMCGNSDIDYQLAVLEQGVSVNFDRWGLDIIYPDDLRKATLIELIKRGFADRIVLSHDHIAQWLTPQPEMPEFAKLLIANWSYTHIFNNILPSLKQSGITDGQLKQLLVENPRRIFE
jgi:phosphotriesterase-related protein